LPESVRWNHYACVNNTSGYFKHYENPVSLRLLINLGWSNLPIYQKSNMTGLLRRLPKKGFSLTRNDFVVPTMIDKNLFARQVDFKGNIKYNNVNTVNTNNTSGLNSNNFWHSLFSADSVAVIGAKDIVGSWGYDCLRSLITPVNAGVKRAVYAVNPNVREILGLGCYNTILDIAGPVELAVIVVPANIVPSVMRQCVEKKVKAAVIISAGFAEVDEDGARLQDEVVKIAREGGIRFIGPNCIGHADMYTQLASAGVAGRVKAGPMTLLSQSGTLGASIMGIAASNGIGLSKLVSTGNEADLHLEDYLEYLENDEKTRIIAAYIEGLREGRRFYQLAKRITTKKPIVALKTGTTEESGRAAKSHTGALAGSDVVYSAAFKQSGVIRVEDEEELSDVMVGLLNQPLPRGNRVGILTMGGGFGVVTAEACEKEGLKIATLEPQTIEKLNGILPPRWSHGNPIDLVGIRSMSEDKTTLSCLYVLFQDKNVDSVISLIPPLASVPHSMSAYGPEQMRAIQIENQRNMEILTRDLKQYSKPFFLIRRFTGSPPGEGNAPVPESTERIPEYTTPRRAAKVLKHLTWYRQYLENNK
jgi:acyl-CoA synthetase (NDP forming)